MIKFRKLIKTTQSSLRLNKGPRFLFATKKEPLPSIAESIKDVTVISYLKSEGEFIHADDEVLEVETHKGNFKVRSKLSGQLVKYLVPLDQDIEIGTEYLEVDIDAQPNVAKATEAPKPKAEEPVKTEAKQAPVKAPEAPAKATPKETPKTTEKAKPTPSTSGYLRQETTEKMSRLRRTVADRLKHSQNTYAQVTTFQEIDMGEIMKLRKEIGDDFLKRNGVKLGFMSFFLKAVAQAIKERPTVNSVISESGTEIIHRNFVDISVAVSSPKGLVVPVVRDVNQKSFAEIESALGDLVTKASTNQLALEDMEGGTFTISNGGVFGSMLSVPIINPPQSAILGMHNIVNRPVVRGDQIVARPIMYVSMSYDHRLLDGREGAGFLKRVSDLLEDPRKLLLEL